MPKKNILISGGSDGLGKALAAKLAKDHQVIILSHNEEKLKQASQEINCDYAVADVTDYNGLEVAVKKIIDKYQQIDVLINNAGVWMQGKLEDNEASQIESLIKVNTLGTIFLTKAVVPFMKKSGGGRIINIVSQDGLRSKKDRSIYSSSKWAITGFTKCLIEDYSESHIAITGIYPGLIKTSLFEKQGAVKDLTNALEPSEIAKLVEFVINLPLDTLVPDISIKNINNPNNMDDTSSTPQIGLDINPDLITPQTGIPSPTNSVAPPTETKPVETTSDKGVIDITPSESTPTVGLTPSANSSDMGVIDITPADKPEPMTESAPAVGAHLADLVPQTPASTEPAVSTPLEPTSLSTPLPSTTTNSSLLGLTSTPEALASSVTPTSSPLLQTQEEITPTSPLAENPDLVKIGK